MVGLPHLGRGGLPLLIWALGIASTWYLISGSEPQPVRGGRWRGAHGRNFKLRGVGGAGKSYGLRLLGVQGIDSGSLRVKFKGQIHSLWSSSRVRGIDSVEIPRPDEESPMEAASKEKVTLNSPRRRRWPAPSLGAGAGVSGNPRLRKPVLVIGGVGKPPKGVRVSG